MSDALFAERKPERAGVPTVAWVVAALAVVVAAGIAAVATRHAARPGSAVLPLDAYASQLTIAKIAMSESTSLSGGKSTYIDGTVKNAGTRTVTAATVQVLFANDESMPPQVETTPLMLIRAREPYVDTQMLAAAPLKPGEERDFRLTFEGIGGNWNQQIPIIHIVQVQTQ